MFSEQDLLFIFCLNCIYILALIYFKVTYREADVLKNPCKATRFYYDSHDCKSNSKCILQEGWLASLEGFAVPLAGLFHLICPSVSDTIFVTFKFTILRF